MAEWSKAAVLKTVEGNTSVGSNPTPSANKIAVQFYIKILKKFLERWPSWLKALAC
jgi:hypothetical protein